MEIKLTKEADRLLSVAYREYLSRRKNKQPKSISREFVDGYWNTLSTFQDWLEEDISDAMRELGQSGLLRIYIDGGCELTDYAIALMEDRFADNLKEITSYIAQFIP